MWQAIADLTANDGAYEWTVPASASPYCLVRVSERPTARRWTRATAASRIRGAGSPVGGHWSGLTSRTQPMSFDVSADGSLWTDFSLSAPVQAGVGTVAEVPGPGAIVNGSFAVTYASGTFQATGTITSENTASGTYTFSSYYLGPYGYSRTGMWTASAPALAVVSPNGGE